MGEQDDKIFYYKRLQPEGSSVQNVYIRKLAIRWDVVLSIVAERAIQALALGTALAIAITYAQSKGGLC